MAKIAINGFGRIGRSFLREAFGRPEFEIVAVNDLTDAKTLAYLLKYDSAYGRYKNEIEVSDNSFKILGKEIKVLAEKDPSKLPWKDLGIDVVLESTGAFATYEKSEAHLKSGAKRVVITAPAAGEVTTALVGVNEDRFKTAKPITCNASCTTNSVAAPLTVLMENFGIVKASMVTVHGYTPTQNLMDGPIARDMRRGRAAAGNIVPSTTGAAEAVIQAIPELEGKFGALSVRVPTITGSLSVMNVLTGKTVTREEVNDLFRESAGDERWKKIMAVTEDPLVSTDIIGEPYGVIVDLTLTKVVDGNLVSVFSWYDNEAGYTATLVEHVRRIAENL